MSYSPTTTTITESPPWCVWTVQEYAPGEGTAGEAMVSCWPLWRMGPGKITDSPPVHDCVAPVPHPTMVTTAPPPGTYSAKLSEKRGPKQGGGAARAESRNGSMATPHRKDYTRASRRVNARNVGCNTGIRKVCHG